MRRREQGFSILEMLVAMALLALVMDILYSLLVPGLRIWMRSRARTELQQDAVVATYRLTTDFGASAAESARLTPMTYMDPVTGATEECDTFSFYSAYNDNGLETFTDPVANPPGGDLQFVNTIVYYVDKVNNQLCRQIQPLTPTTNPVKAAAAVYNSAGPQPQVIARDLLNFTVVPTYVPNADPTSTFTMFQNPVVFNMSFRYSTNQFQSLFGNQSTPNVPYTNTATVTAQFTNI